MFRNPADLPPSKNAEERQVIIESASKHGSALKNPCLKEEKLSFKCLEDNPGDRDKCASYFENYRTCREFWNKVQRDRRTKGITPVLPHPAEREEVKRSYMKQWTTK